jgi:hypothetical protein
MKNVFYLLLSAFTMLFALNSCKTDELDLDKTLKFSKLTVEEQKEKIEKSGIEFVDKMDGMQDTKAFKAGLQFIDKTDAAAAAPLKILHADLKNRNTNVLRNFDRQLRVSYVESDIWGEWEWKPALNDFALIRTLTNKAIYRFPATETSTTNNAEITIVYVETDIQVPDSEDYYPSSITYTMKVDGSKVMEAEFSGSYKSDGTPIKVKQSLVMGDYSWSAEINNKSTEASGTYEFKLKSETLVKMEASAKGDLIAEKYADAEYPDEFMQSGAIYFQMMNIAVFGGLKDMSAFVDDMNAISNTETRAGYEAQANVVNKHLICYGYYVDDKKKFADIEFYVLESNDYDINGDGKINSLDVEYTLQPRFVLSDGSKVDIQNYIETGFEDLITKLEEYEDIVPQ